MAKSDSLIVVLDDAIDNEILKPVLEAIAQIKHVISVKPHTHDFQSLIAKEQVRNELERKILSVLRNN